MALADTELAIREISELLVSHLTTATRLDIKVGRPEPAEGESGERLNLFLYETLFDPNLKNTPLDEGIPPPLWLTLKYLLTAFDDGGKSDSAKAHGNLGRGIRALQGLSYIPLSDSGCDALKDNPEVLKITFDEASSDLLAKLMQGADEKYRFSVGFQVRPVMIATGELPSYSLLVGVDYTKSPIEKIGEKGIKIPTLPTLGPSITRMEPHKFMVNETLTIYGSDLNLSGMAVHLGSVELDVSAQRRGSLRCLVNGSITGGDLISAGSHPISVVQTLPDGRHRSSNLLVCNLLPQLESATVMEGSIEEEDHNVFGAIELTGVLLGSEDDDIFIALYKDGETVEVFEIEPGCCTSDQSKITFSIPPEYAVPPGIYRIILKVNGQQARSSPEVEIVA